MPLRAGQTLHSRYRVDSLLGQGGMGAVYKAWDTSLHILVAVKENLDASPQAQKQFGREARFLARLSHPNLPRVSDFFFVPGQGQYLVMDFVDGEDLSQMMDRLGLLPEPDVLNWISQICDALAYLHSQPSPIIHRDIKPANIKIRPDGRAMLVDFGIAKVYDPNLATTIGAKAITPGYSPAEQYGAGITDARSDIYALGATLYHLLTGQKPPESVELAIGSAQLLPPRQLNRRISPTTERAILKAVEVATDRRFQSVDELLAALTYPSTGKGEEIVPGPPDLILKRTMPRQPRSRSPLYRPVILAAVGLVVVAVVVVALLLPGILNPSPTPTPAASPTAQPAVATVAILTNTPASTVAVVESTATPTLIPTPTPIPVPEYAGLETCSECHQDYYAAFVRSGHAYKLNPVVDGRPPIYPFTVVPDPPEGYTWDDITYVIGGYNWKARFIDEDGYIITGDENAITQYSLANEVLGVDAQWVAYHAGELEKPYDCGPCHTTGYSSLPWGASQDDLPGLIGTWAEPGITCERCHGPGSLHVGDPSSAGMKIDRDNQLCGECHRRGDVEIVNASGGFVKHHEQYEELFQSMHIALDCVECHDPHLGVIQLRKSSMPTTRVECEECHPEEAGFQRSDVHPAAASCIDCHMPRVTKSAVGNAELFMGDIRTHLMSIDPDQIGQFTEDGFQALSQLGLDFACRHCHNASGPAPVKSDEQLIEMATGYHERP